jgi:hypothetical protein
MKPPREKTPAQNRTLNWLLNEAGLFDDHARDCLQSVCGKRYRRDMDFSDYQRAIDAISRMYGIRIKGSKGRIIEGRQGQRHEPLPKLRKSDPMTGLQREKMFELYHEIGAVNVRQQRGISEKAVGKPWPFTVGEAQKVIEALKNMKDRGYRMDDAPAPGLEEERT